MKKSIIIDDYLIFFLPGMVNEKSLAVKLLTELDMGDIGRHLASTLWTRRGKRLNPLAPNSQIDTPAKPRIGANAKKVTRVTSSCEDAAVKKLGTAVPISTKLPQNANADLARTSGSMIDEARSEEVPAKTLLGPISSKKLSKQTDSCNRVRTDRAPLRETDSQGGTFD